MPRNDTHFWVNKTNIARARPQFRRVERAFREFPGRCYFVTDDKGSFCEMSAVSGHVIPKGAVLDSLKDPSTGKVMELRWGFKQWEHLVVSSDEEHPIHFLNPLTYTPPLVGIGSAGTGRFSCDQHDKEFSLIDESSPDLDDPRVPFLTLYRNLSYLNYLTQMAQVFVNQNYPRQMQDPEVANRIVWRQATQRLRKAESWIKPLTVEIGVIWHGSRDSQDILAGQVLARDWEFRSAIKFAASLIYDGTDGDSLAITVVPLDKDWHKMTAVGLSQHDAKLQRPLTHLAELVEASEAQSQAGFDVLQDLMTSGSGIAVAKPDSYHSLSDAGRAQINNLVISLQLQLMTDRRMKRHVGSNAKKSHKGRRRQKRR